MTAYDSLWQLMTAYDNLWQLMTANDSLWQLMTAYDNLLQLITTYDNLWQLMTTYDNLSHPSWMGQSTKIMTREVVCYILSGTPRAPQKCFRSNLIVEFLGENHLFLICEKMPNQTLQLIKYLDSGWNSDLFEKNCWNLSTNCKVRAVQKWLPFSKNVQNLLSVTVQTCPIWIFFFLNRSEFNP